VKVETLAERTLQLCAIRSPIGEEAEIAAHVQSATGGERIGNAVVAGRAGGGKPAVILAGHLDPPAERRAASTAAARPT